MLDEKAIDSKLEKLKEEILQESAHNMRVILESSVDKKLNLIIEAVQTQKEAQVPKEQFDELEEEVAFLRSIIRQHSREIEALKHA